MNKELYVSTTPHETKVALVEDDSLAEVYFERENEYTLAGSIYKGRVTRVLPGMQSAFVDIGLERDAFLYVSDFLDFQDEDEEGEFGEVKVTGQTLAQANGLIVPNEVVDEEEEEPAEAVSAAPEENDSEGAQQEGGARRWKGRRRRRGRRGGRDRMVPERQTEAQAAPEEPSEVADEELADTVTPLEAEPIEEVAQVPEPPTSKALPAGEPERILLPGESIAKYTHGGSASTSPEEIEAAEEQPAQSSYRERERDRGRRGRNGRGRDRGRDRDRGDRDRSERPRETEEYTLPENYTPIVLPGESISKYRDVEPTPISEEAATPEQIEAPEAELESPTATVAEPPVQTFEDDEPEPLERAEYSAGTDLPALKRVEEEPVVEQTESEHAPLTQAAMQEPMLGETAAAIPTILPDRAPEPETAPEPVEEPAAATHEVVAPEAEAKEEEVEEQVAEAPVAEAQPEEEPAAAPKRASWRNRLRNNVAAIFGSEQTDEEQSSEEKPQSQHAARPHAAEDEESEASTHQPGSFVIEGGNVEHEELDEEEADLPTLSERYGDEDEEADEHHVGNGSVLSDTVRDSDEEQAIEEEEYDFGGEEFEESEMLASDEEAEEEPEEAEVAPAPQGRPERPGFERRGGRHDRGRGGRRPRPRPQSRAIPQITDLLKEGQEVLIQIAKEPIGKKGARITSHIALPGRFLVYMPTVNHIGVSRKINSEEERQRLKRIVSSERENGHGGFIVRTAAANIKEDELRADIRFLKHLWQEIRTRADNSKSPALIYHDLNLVERVLRDQVTSDFSQIWVDNEQEYERVVRFASRFQPNLVRRIKLYTKDTPLFEQFGIQEEINKSLKSKVWLKSGGYIVINQTEALVAIDINTGKYVGKTARLEDTIVKTNVDAIKEIVRQIRLRDLGGIIVIDFIDMDERKNRQKVMAALEEALKADRAPSKVLQFNDFGLVAITRKRVKQSLERTLGTPCPYCVATGFVKSVPTICNEIYVEMRKIRKHIDTADVTLRVNPEVAKGLKAENGKWLQEMEEMIGHPVLVKSDAQLHQEHFDIQY